MFLAFIVAGISLLSSCRKIDFQKDGDTIIEKQYRIDKFYQHSPNIDPITLKVINKIKSFTGSNEWIPNFAQRKGYPLWNKSLIVGNKIHQTSFTSSSASNPDTILIVPIILQDSSIINGYIRVVLNDSITLSYRLSEHYSLLPQAISGISPRTEFVFKMMTLNKLVFGDSVYAMVDSNAIRYNNNSIKYVTLKNTVSVNVLSYVETCQVAQVTWNNCGEAITSIAGTNISSMSNPCLNYIDIPYCTGSWIDDGVWPNNDGGGTSGSETGTSGSGPVGPGGSSGGSGSGSSEPDPGGWVPIRINPDDDPGPFPCARAEFKSKKLDTLYDLSSADSMLSSIPNLPTETNEKGFVVFRKYEINPHSQFDTTFTGYSLSQMFTGTDSTINMSYFVPNRSVVACVFHTHPPNGYAAQSANDMYVLIESIIGNQNLVGNIVRSANGSEYGIGITDHTKAQAFLNTKSLFLNGASWNETSAIGKAFEKARRYFRMSYKTDPNVENIAYEMAMASVLTEFNTGITLSKKNAQGNFGPLVVRRVSHPLDPQKSYYLQDCQ